MPVCPWMVPSSSVMPMASGIDTSPDLQCLGLAADVCMDIPFTDYDLTIYDLDFHNVVALAVFH